MKSFILASLIVLICTGAAVGQTFNSGSTGTDGALAPAENSGVYWVQLPESGVLNYTTIATRTVSRSSSGGTPRTCR